MQLVESAVTIHSDDNTVAKDSPLQIYFTKFGEALELAKIPDPSEHLKKYAEDAGFINVECHQKKLPWGAWPKDPKQKELGRWTLAVLETGFKAYGLALFNRYLKMNEESAEELCNAAFRNLYDRRVHAYNFQWYISGEKPTET